MSIDYEKLRVALELAEEYKNMGYLCSIEIIFSPQQFCYEIMFFWTTFSEKKEEIFLLDEVIAKLRELTQPEEPKAKYKVGDEVWAVFGEEIESFTVDAVVGKKYYLHKCDYGLIREIDLYPTKSALIEAQIAYWQSLQEETVELPSALNQPTAKDYEEANPHLLAAGFKFKNHSEDVREPFKCEYCGSLREVNSQAFCCGLYNTKVDSSHIQEKFCTPAPPEGPYRCSDEIDNYRHQDKVGTGGCQHEGDGQAYYGKGQFLTNCIKCGEFYR